MKNILATLSQKSGFGFRPSAALVLAGCIVAAMLWGIWTTRELLELRKRQVVTVQLSRIMGDFVDAEARAGHAAEQSRALVEAYLKAVDSSVQALGQQGRTVLVAEAVVAGAVPDMTEQVRADVARRMEAPRHAAP